MGFFDEVINLFKGEEVDSSYKLMVLGDYGLVVEGYKRIVSLEESEIVIELKSKAKIMVSGIKLYIKKLEVEELVIAGKILEFKIL